ncbi:MAG: 1-(5-phosphoribosyl)-5-[(5-phosphoribosylamino)methylideneamino]imidazole-4-carboxamide isomerase [Firmicutes bacterium]|nr:1-(5-phosphoribosyl)-5-[(5-phosphoribosylamino)methylideneamino]imidazole-4-carboxamide isomerase [Bacillota bacterium]
MIIYPAIDLLDGKCVRLYKGDYEKVEQVADCPFATAEKFTLAGATHLHVVDLNASKNGERVNHEIIKKLAKSGLKVQTGGGIRNRDSILASLDAGVSRVIIGSKAVEDREFLINSLKEFGDKIIVGVDAENGIVKTAGWLKSSGINYLGFIKEIDSLGVRTVVFTDISKDGTLGGVSLESYKILKKETKLNVIASGGVKDLSDIEALKQIGVYGAICGKSLYAGTLNLAKAVAVAGQK